MKINDIHIVLYLITSLMLFSCAGTDGSGGTSEPPNQPQPDIVRGTVESLDLENSLLTVEGENYRVPESAAINVNGESKTLNEIRLNQFVTLQTSDSDSSK